MSELLEKFAEFELVCDSGDGTRMKVEDIGLMTFDCDRESKTTLHENHPHFNVPYIVFGLEVLEYVIPTDRYYHKGTKDFEKVFEKFLIERILK